MKQKVGAPFFPPSTKKRVIPTTGIAPVLILLTLQGICAMEEGGIYSIETSSRAIVSRADYIERLKRAKGYLCNG